MNTIQSTTPRLFKGIALFTPGGDLIYCIDPTKQRRWHLHLCVALQEVLALPEPPHFLVPCYTATVDQWIDPNTQNVKLSAEAYPPVLRYQTLLNAVFDTGDLTWQAAPVSEEVCSPLVMATYYHQFPELWENHDLVINLKNTNFSNSVSSEAVISEQRSPSLRLNLSPQQPFSETQGFVLRLYVSGHSVITERTLKTLHQLLEQSIGHPYTLKVIDVLKHPELAEADQISATPTLVKVWPKPMRRIVGELNNVETIVRLLGCLDDG